MIMYSLIGFTILVAIWVFCFLINALILWPITVKLDEYERFHNTHVEFTYFIQSPIWTTILSIYVSIMLFCVLYVKICNIPNTYPTYLISPINKCLKYFENLGLKLWRVK